MSDPRSLLPDLLIVGHALLMMTSLILLTTFTIYLRQILALESPPIKKSKPPPANRVLRWLSKNLPTWLPRDFEDAHLLVQGAAVILLLAGFNFAVFAKDEGHFQSLHSWLGLCLVVLFGIALPLTGMVDVSMAAETQRMFTTWHRKYGRIVWQAAFLVVATGAIQLWKWFA